MSHVRYAQILFWSGICLLLAPSKITAISYAIVIGGLLIAVLITLGLGRVIISAIRRLFQ